MNDYQKYLAKLHSQNITSDEIIKDAIKEATNLAFKSKTRIISGEANEVYEIGLENNQKIIMRISRSKEKTFMQEKWAIDKCKNAGVPVPEMLLIKHLNLEDKVLSICIQNKIDGDTLERGNMDYFSLDKNTRHKIINKAGEILSKIHSVKTVGFGYLNEKGEGNYKTFIDLMKENTNNSDEYLKLARKIEMKESEMKNILQIVEKTTLKIPNVNSYLSHNDFGPKHMIVKDDKITGIIDFGEVCGHSPVNDFAKWAYWFLNFAPLEWIKEGYNNKNIFDENFENLLHLVKLNNGLGVLWWYYKGSYNKAVQKAKERLLEDLKYFI